MFAKLLVAMAFLGVVVAQYDFYDDKRHLTFYNNNTWSVIDAAAPCVTNGVHVFMVLMSTIIAWVLIK